MYYSSQHDRNAPIKCLQIGDQKVITQMLSIKRCKKEVIWFRERQINCVNGQMLTAKRCKKEVKWFRKKPINCANGQVWSVWED